MNKNEFYGKLCELLELAPGAVRGDIPLERLDGWDSVAVITFIALADSEYSVALPPKGIAECRSVDDLADLILLHQGANAVK